MVVDGNDARANNVAIQQNLASARAGGDELFTLRVDGDDDERGRLPGSRRVDWSPSLTRAADTEETGTLSSRVRRPSRTASSVQPERATNPVTRIATRPVAHNDGEETDTMQLDKRGVCWCSSTFDNVRDRPIGPRRRRIAKKSSQRMRPQRARGSP